MNLDDIWTDFLKNLADYPHFSSISKKIYSGVPFIYLQTKSDVSQKTVELSLKKASALSMKGKRLHSETIFVRNDHHTFVYRHRFFVPQEKMFCCGNLCVNCVRLRKKP